MRQAAPRARDDEPHGTLIEAIRLAELCEVDALDQGTARINHTKGSLLPLGHRCLEIIPHGLAKIWVQRAARKTIGSASSFGDHVFHVIGLGALKQMAQSAAEPIVAVMKNMQIRMHRAVNLFSISVAMGTLTATVNGRRAVSRIVRGAHPIPARIGFSVGLPKLVSRHSVNLSLRHRIFNYAIIG